MIVQQPILRVLVWNFYENFIMTGLQISCFFKSYEFLEQNGIKFLKSFEKVLHEYLNIVYAFKMASIFGCLWKSYLLLLT